MRDDERAARAFLGAALLAVALTGVVALPLAWLAAGAAGVLGAAIGLGFLLALFGLSALVHWLAAPFGTRLWVGLTAGGFGLRIVLYFAVVRMLDGVDAFDNLSLGLTAAGGILVGQVLEMRALVRQRTRPATPAPGTRRWTR